MKISRRDVTLGGLATGFAAAAGVSMIVPAKAQSLSPTETRQIAEDAYVYGIDRLSVAVFALASSRRRRARHFSLD